MTEQKGEKDERSVVPDCPVCGRPLGLFYAECGHCAVHADDYSYRDYVTRFPSVQENSGE